MSVSNTIRRHRPQPRAHLRRRSTACCARAPSSSPSSADEDDLAAPSRDKYPQAKRVADRRAILEDALHRADRLTSAIPAERAGIAIAAMRHGKDVMSDKPGMTSLAQLAEIKRVQAGDRPHLLGLLLRALRDALDGEGRRTGAGRRHRRGRSTPSASARTAPAQPSGRTGSSTASATAASSSDIASHQCRAVPVLLGHRSTPK